MMEFYQNGPRRHTIRSDRFRQTDQRFQQVLPGRRRGAHRLLKVHLADGLGMDYVIECPKHNGQFDYRNGEAGRAPVCEDLATCPARAENGRVLVRPG